MDLKELGAEIKAARKEAGLRQDELAVKAEITREALSRIETGKQNICFDTLQKIATALKKQLPERWLV